MRIAVLSDIHGNAWALDAVLEEMKDVDADRVLNLGDCFFGPLDPGGTYARLLGWDWPTVRGNQDRSLLEAADNPTAVFTLGEIGDEGVEWLAERTELTVRQGPILACHGDLEHDDVTLIERVEPTFVRTATEEELLEAVGGRGGGIEVFLCGHSHQPGTVRLADGRLVVNPGSVGLPAYRADTPHPHGMEAGTPHARWAVLERIDAGWKIELRVTPYDVTPAVEAARRNGRPDWARWIETGRAVEVP
ncbi:MAG: metallophosphoesterase family protein [Gemmatimonadota bacterium]|jgi:putative phosphoesterase